WIPDAANDAPLPFMAFFPAALEKLLGIYFLARISLDMFKLEPNSWPSILLMTIGAITILLAVMMALIQKEYKRLLSYHAISQVGYMILGVGTCLPAGIIGGLFHMINNALYKSCLFFTGGSVEKQAGTTYLEKLGGLGVKMPVTFACFLISALSISGVPPFNGFVSKEMIYDAALERNIIFYVAAVLGSFFTAASFLKLGHAAFLGKINNDNKNVKEAPWSMLVPMIIIASLCIFFGVRSSFPVNNFLVPILGAGGAEGRVFSGAPVNYTLIMVTIIILLGALLNHMYGARIMGSGLKAADHIRHAPVLNYLYDRAEKKYFDPYEIGMSAVNKISKAVWIFDRKIDWIYDNASVDLSYAFSRWIRQAHSGYYVIYIGWSIAGSLAVILFAMLFK
ncbi:MAG: proton-conducting transporter membrane subunit, partial [Candidatus Omnitrophica bacterium]|nr:proton-conducting transporter membrane subunit [Candidatus Omnitrophota bacterium]